MPDADASGIVAADTPRAVAADAPGLVTVAVRVTVASAIFFTLMYKPKVSP